MDEHQQRMWGRMLESLDAFDGGDIDLTKLVADLDGLLTAADPHDEQLREDFYVLWIRLQGANELRIEPWAPRGSFDEARLRADVQSLRQWLEDVPLSAVIGEHD